MKTIYKKLILLTFLLCCSLVTVAQENVPEPKTVDTTIEAALNESEVSKKILNDQTHSPQEETTKAETDDSFPKVTVSEDKVPNDTTPNQIDILQKEITESEKDDSLTKSVANEEKVSNDTTPNHIDLPQEEITEAEKDDSLPKVMVSEDKVPNDTIPNHIDLSQEEITEAEKDDSLTESAVNEEKVSNDTIPNQIDSSQEEITDIKTSDTLPTAAQNDKIEPKDSVGEEKPVTTSNSEVSDTLIKVSTEKASEVESKDTLNKVIITTTKEETLKDTVVKSVDSALIKFTLSGTITDIETGDNLIGINVIEEGTSNKTTTNKEGFYSLLLTKGPHKITYSFKNYKTEEKEVKITENKELNIKLQSSIKTLSKMVIVDEKKNENITSTEMSIEKFDIEEVETIPVIMGEKDIMKTIQLVPGITSVTEGRSAIVVRGGSIDQNQIMMDGMPIYYFSHMNGLYSIFNSEAMEDMVVYKGGIPSQYGGRSASFLDLTMKEGDNQDYHGSVGVGLIASNLYVEGPIIKDKMSFFWAGRSTRLGIGRLIDTILVGRDTTSLDEGEIKDRKNVSSDDPRIFTSSGAFFNDMNAKIVYHINDNNSLYLSGYWGKDGESEGVIDFFEYPKEWGNRAATLRWSHEFSPKLLSNTSLIYSEYETHAEPPNGSIIESGIRTGGLRQEFSWFPNTKNKLIFGLCSEYMNFNHGTIFGADENSYVGLGNSKSRAGEKFMPPMQSIESAIFISHDQKIGSKLSAYYGLRYSLFHRIGSGKQMTYNDFNTPIDSLYFHRREIMQFYHNLEPRFSLNYIINDKNSVKFSYNRTVQYLRLMTNSMQLQFFDIWMPCTKNIKPLISDQVALGYFRNFLDNAMNFSIETFYKKSKGEFDFEDGLQDYFQPNLEAFVATGKGRSYGMELMLKKPSGRFTGWLGYNLSKSEIQIDCINNGEWYRSKFDKTHDVTIVSNFKIFEGLSISATWLYTTGNAVSLPEGSYQMDEAVIPYYSRRNKYKMPDYHRLDLGITYSTPLLKKFFKRFERELKTSLEISLYNVYNRRNINYIDFRKIKSKTQTGNSALVPYGVSLYGAMPSFLFKLIF